MQRIRLAGLLKLELPDSDVLLSDGGTVVFGGDTYLSKHATMGTISAIETVTEGVGDAAPSGTITFLPAPGANVDDVCHASMQGSRLRVWVAEIDDDTGATIGTPRQEQDSVIDIPRLVLGAGKRLVEMDFAGSLERLFIVNRGNALSGEFHRRIYPGERGLDNATGVSSQFAWGVASAPRGTSGTMGTAFRKIVENM
jgi:hypothetical protein